MMADPPLHRLTRTALGREKPLFLYVVNVDWFFLSHRLPLALAARDSGADVVVVAGDSGQAEAIRDAGLPFIPVPLSRKGTNPWVELRTIFFLLRIYRKLRPDLIHHVTIKPVIYGSIAARAVSSTAVINTISGLGFAFSRDRRAAVLRPAVQLLYRIALRHPRSRTIFQNADDAEEFIAAGMIPRERALVVRGSGVDLARFCARPEPPGPPIVLMASRMLWDKGVGVFVDAARAVKKENPAVRFVLAGSPDEGNPSSVPVSSLRGWVEEGAVEWWGYRQDMSEVLSGAHIVVLPAIHREGLPKVLLEAAACARPLVASDVPGCREIVRPGISGILVPPGNPQSLARALGSLLASPSLRQDLGSKARSLVVAEFGDRLVLNQILRLYERELDMFGEARGAPADPR